MIKSDDFYSVGIADAKIIDRFIYRGRGRPRKTDYSTSRILDKKINIVLFLYLFIVKYGTKIHA